MENKHRLLWLPFLVNSCSLLFLIILILADISEDKVFNCSDIYVYEDSIYSQKLMNAHFPSKLEMGNYLSVKYSRRKKVDSILLGWQYSIGHNLLVDYNPSEYVLVKNDILSNNTFLSNNDLNDVLRTTIFNEKLVIRNFEFYFFEDNLYWSDYYYNGALNFKFSISFVAFNDQAFQISYFYLDNKENIRFWKGWSDYYNPIIFLDKQINNYFKWYIS